MTINFKYKVLFMLHFLLYQVRCGTLLFDLKLVTNAPDGAESPGRMILDLFPQPFDMDVDGSSPMYSYPQIWSRSCSRVNTWFGDAARK